MIAIGIDTGSTSTDAVVYELEKRALLAFAKSVTTHESLETGILESLRKLPRELTERAAYLSLSTTLATNACVEGKGERVCLLFIGADRRAVEWTLTSYGFESMEFMRFLDADAKRGVPPDWAALDGMLPEIVREYDAVAIAQHGARENDALYEREAAARIARSSAIPVTCSYEIFRELNVIKRGAGALLNARISAEIRRFFEAIHRALEAEGYRLPVFIMRSDGSLVSEEYTLRYPVETLVCGPTASVKGAMELFQERQAVVVDMGGTTCDMAILRDGRPKLDDEGIRLAGWQTFVKGVSIETLALGGDSRVRYKNRSLSLDARRVLPVSVLAGRYPGVLEELERLAAEPHGSMLPMHEHFLRLRDAQDAPEDAQACCAALAGGPLSLTKLAKATGTDAYHLNTEALERQGLILRCGFTPTDAILLKGDRKDDGQGAYGTLLKQEAAARAAELALRFLAASTGLTPEEILDEIYRQVKEKLYCALAALLWRDAHGGRAPMPRELDALAREAFAAAQRADGAPRFYRGGFATDAVLLGTGAPVHIFLPDVARALGTVWRVSPYSGVSNALGAVLGDVCVYETVQIRTDFVAPEADTGSGNYIVYGARREAFEEPEDAVRRAAALAEERAAAKALRCGAKALTSVTHEVRLREGATNYGNVPMGGFVTACARGRLLPEAGHD